MTILVNSKPAPYVPINPIVVCVLAPARAVQSHIPSVISVVLPPEVMSLPVEFAGMDPPSPTEKVDSMEIVDVSPQVSGKKRGMI
jgi:hypothetical protein